MPVELYGATVAGVVNLVPELRLDAADPAVVDKVTGFLELAADIVTPRVGATFRGLAAIAGEEAAAVYVILTGSAGRVVELGAASLLQDSSYPELAATSETDQAWGAVLWRRFEQALDGLAAGLEAELERLGVDVVTGAPATPDVYAPPPFFTSRQRF